MLLETKGVVHMALLFGSTWMVNSIVFFAILVMILCSNLFVLVGQARATLAVLRAARRASLVVEHRRADEHASCALPGIARRSSRRAPWSSCRSSSPASSSRRRSATAAQPDVDFGSNIAGAMLGGLTESLSLMVGFNYLLVVALTFYVLSAVLSRGRGTAAVHALQAAPQ